MIKKGATNKDLKLLDTPEYSGLPIPLSNNNNENNKFKNSNANTHKF